MRKMAISEPTRDLAVDLMAIEVDLAPRIHAFIARFSPGQKVSARDLEDAFSTRSQQRGSPRTFDLMRLEMELSLPPLEPLPLLAIPPLQLGIGSTSKPGATLEDAAGLDHTVVDPPIQVEAEIATDDRSLESSSPHYSTDHSFEVVCFEDVPVAKLLPSPMHNNFVTFTRGSSIAIPLHFPPKASTPIKNIIADFTYSICKARWPVALQSTPLR